MNNSNLVFTVSLWEILLIVLLLVAIGALVYLVKALKNFSSMTNNVSLLLEKNKEELDSSIKSLPVITNQLEETLNRVNDLLDESGDDITSSISELRQGLENVNRISNDAADTVEYVAATAIDAADIVSDGLNRSSNGIEKAFDTYKRLKDLFRW